jgi:hypothetical protein
MDRDRQAVLVEAARWREGQPIGGSELRMRGLIAYCLSRNARVKADVASAGFDSLPLANNERG